MVDSNRINDRVSLLTHEIYATRIENNPRLLRQAGKQIDLEVRSNGGTLGERLWQQILRQPWPAIRRRMLQDGPDGRLLRSNSPFSALIGVRDTAERRQLWQTAQQDLSTARI